MPRAAAARAYNHVMAPRRAQCTTSRRQFLRTAPPAQRVAGGCIRTGSPRTGKFDKLWGLPGGTPGRLFRPRAVAIDKDDLLYIVDMTPQIQVFTGDGDFIRGWQTPHYEKRPAVGPIVR